MDYHTPEQLRKQLAHHNDPAGQRVYLSFARPPSQEVPTRWPNEQPPPESVLMFEKELGSGTRKYTYVAYRVPDITIERPWFLTQGDSKNSPVGPFDWSSLRNWIGEYARVMIAPTWVEIPPLPQPEQEDPGEWARAHFGQKRVIDPAPVQKPAADEVAEKHAADR